MRLSPGLLLFSSLVLMWSSRVTKKRGTKQGKEHLVGPIWRLDERSMSTIDSARDAISSVTDSADKKDGQAVNFKQSQIPNPMWQPTEQLPLITTRKRKDQDYNYLVVAKWRHHQSLVANYKKAVELPGRNEKFYQKPHSLHKNVEGRLCACTSPTPSSSAS